MAQTSETFIRCLENAFRYFGGVTRTVIIDNLRAAVSQADWFDPALNPKLEEICRHYGMVILPCKPVMPRHKGKIESGVNYGQENARKGHRFERLAAQNLHLLHWENHVADKRIHGTTKQQVARIFNEVEKAQLLQLPQACSRFSRKPIMPCIRTAISNWRRPTTLSSWCRWSDSNRHNFLGFQDFKSCASAISPHRHPVNEGISTNLKNGA